MHGATIKIIQIIFLVFCVNIKFIYKHKHNQLLIGKFLGF